MCLFGKFLAFVPCCEDLWGVAAEFMRNKLSGANKSIRVQLRSKLLRFIWIGAAVALANL